MAAVVTFDRSQPCNFGAVFIHRHRAPKFHKSGLVGRRDKKAASTQQLRSAEKEARSLADDELEMVESTALPKSPRGNLKRRLPNWMTGNVGKDARAVINIA